MPLPRTYPGVYIEEVPSGVRTIIGVATSITAFIGRAARGPVNDPTTINSYGDYERLFGGLWVDSTMSFAVRDFFLNGGSQAIIVRLHNGASAAKITLPTGAPDPNDALILEAANVGSWGDNLSVSVDYNTKDPADNTLFNLTVTEKGGATEKYFNVTITSLPGLLDRSSNLAQVQKDNAGNPIIPNVRPLETGVEVTPLSPPLSPPTSPPATAAAGSDGIGLTESQFFGTGMAAAKTGLFALEKADLFNLLCLPPFTSSNDVTTAVVAQAAAYCEKRRAMLLVDPPSGWTTKDTARNQFIDPVTDYLGTRSNYAALFFPRLRQPNPLKDNQMEDFVPCGAVAGVFARTDAQRGVWKAPAGQDASLVGVPQFSVQLTDDENGELNQLGINCLRAFPVYGRLVWGARTLEGADRLASEWKYIPVRRTALFIEESLFRSTKWVVFEPNDEPLWAQIRLNIGAFMHNLFRQGAFAGTTPREAYFVKCDRETTTQTDVDQGVVNILVGFAPLKPAEFVVIRIQQMAGQIET
jgi:phage tail sheath protein FI